MLEQVPDSRLGLLAQVCLQVFLCRFNISLLKKKYLKKNIFFDIDKILGLSSYSI